MKKIYQMNTENKSFLDFSLLLKEEGIKNHLFMLELKNENLLYIDPWDGYKTEQQQQQIIDEACNNFWYFAREVIKWRDLDGSLYHTKLDRGNCAMYFNSLNNISTWRSNIRQTYSSISVITFLIWRWLSGYYTDMDAITRDISASKQLKTVVSNIINSLPEYFNIKKHESYKYFGIIDNDKNKIHFNSSRVIIKNGSNIDSDIAFFDGGEFIPNLKSLIENRNLNTREINNTKFTIVNSVIGDDKAPSSLFAEGYIDSMLKWKDTFYDTDISINNVIINNYHNRSVYICHPYNLLGFSEEWFKNYSNMIDDENIIRRELLAQRR
jgi:hypothetical protein